MPLWRLAKWAQGKSPTGRPRYLLRFYSASLARPRTNSLTRQTIRQRLSTSLVDEAGATSTELIFKAFCWSSLSAVRVLRLDPAPPFPSQRDAPQKAPLSDD